MDRTPLIEKRLTRLAPGAPAAMQKSNEIARYKLLKDQFTPSQNQHQPKGTMDCLQIAIDAVSDWTGLKAIPSLLPLKIEKDAVVLDVPCYSQTDSYSCGAIAAWSIVETFRPRSSFARFYDLVQAEPGVGVGPKRVIAALRKFGIGTRTRSSLGWPDIRKIIDHGFPMLVGTGKEDPTAQGDHWSLLLGYLARSKRVYLGNQPGVLRNKTSVSWKEFDEKWWNPRAKAIVCWGT